MITKQPFSYFVDGFRVCVKARKEQDNWVTMLEQQTGMFYLTREEAQEVIDYFIERDGFTIYEIVEGVFSLPSNVTPDRLVPLLQRVDWNKSED